MIDDVKNALEREGGNENENEAKSMKVIESMEKEKQEGIAGNEDIQNNQEEKEKEEENEKENHELIKQLFGSQEEKDEKVEKGRFSILINLPPPPRPPDSIDGFLKRVSLDIKLTEQLKNLQVKEVMSDKDTYVVNPKDGIPYRFRPLPSLPQKPNFPKRSSKGFYYYYFNYYLF